MMKSPLIRKCIYVTRALIKQSVPVQNIFPQMFCWLEVCSSTHGHVLAWEGEQRPSSQLFLQAPAHLLTLTSQQSSFFMLPVHFIYFLNHFCELHDYCTHNHRRVEVIILKAFLQCMHSDQDVICISYPLTPCPKIETKHSVMSDCFELVLIWLEISHKAALVRRDYV